MNKNILIISRLLVVIALLVSSSIMRGQGIVFTKGTYEEIILNELSLRVTKMTEDTVTYTATARDLVDKYNAMKSIADESSTRANEAVVLANQTVIDVSALNTSVFGLQGIADDIQSRITEYGSMANEINGKLGIS